MSVRGFGLLAMWLVCSAGPASAGVTIPADLTIDKTGPAVAAAGSTVDYTVTVTNLSPDPGFNLTLSDPLPAGMTFVASSQTSGAPFTCSTPLVGSGGTITCTVATLAGNDSASFLFSFAIPAGTPPSTFFTNIATITSTLDENEENNSIAFTTQTPAAPMGDLSIAKSAPAVTAANANLVFDVTFTNGGPDASSNATWTDTLPGNLTFVSLSQTSGPLFSCTTPAVGAGGTVQCTLASFATGSASFVLTTHVPPGTPSGTFYTNTAFTSADNDPNEENNSATTGTLVSSADVSVTKSAPANITAGQDLTYVLTLANAGPDPALNVVLSDDLPAPLTFVSLTQDTGPALSCSMPPVGSNGAISCATASFASGISAQFTLAANVPATYSGPALVNTATVSQDSFDPDNSDNTSTTTTSVTPLPIDLAMTKSGPATVAAGQNANYTLTLTNVGSNTAAGVSFTDTLPAGTGFVSINQTSGPTLSCSTPAVGANGPVTCSIATLAAGVSAAFDLVVSVPSGAANGTVLTNSVTASSSGTDSNPADNTATAATTLANQADLAVTKSAPGNATAGTNLVYTLSLASAGPSNAQNVQLSDPLPAGTTFQSLTQNSGPAATCTTPAVGAAGTVSCTFATLASGASASFTLTVAVAPGTPNGTSLNNTATATASTADPNGANNSSTTVTTVTNQADLAITKTGPATAAAGTSISYTVTVSYNGAAAPAANVQWSDPLPSGATFVSLSQTGGPAFVCTTPAAGATGTVTCTIASFANAAVATFTLVATVPTSLASGSTLTNTATTSTTSADANAANNTASSSATVSNNVDLSLSKTGPASLQVGQDASYVLTLTNTGTSPALNVQLTDVMPAGTSFISLTQTTGPAFTCTTPAVGANGTVTCTTASFAGGANATFTLVLGTGGLAPGTLTNSASVTSTSLEAGTANNAASAGTTLLGAPGAATLAVIPTLSLPWLIALAGILAAVALLAVVRRP